MVMRKQDVSFSKRLFVRMLVLLILVSGTSVAQNYPHRSDVLWVTTPDHNDWLYACGEVARVDVALYYYGMLKEGAKVHYEVGPELFPAREKGVLELKEGRAVLELGTLDEPGFLDCRLWVELDGERFRHHVKVGFDPHLLQHYTQLPDDFTAFWEAGKEKAAACPPKVEKEYVPAYSNELVDCYLVKLQVFEKGQFMYGYLTMPKAEGKYPVVIAPPGAGVKPMDPLKDIFYAEQGLIRFEMEIHGIRPDMDRAAYEEVSRAFARGGNSYLVNGLDDRDNYYMKKVYLGLMGATHLLIGGSVHIGTNAVNLHIEPNEALFGIENILEGIHRFYAGARWCYHHRVLPFRLGHRQIAIHKLSLFKHLQFHQITIHQLVRVSRYVFFFNFGGTGSSFFLGGIPKSSEIIGQLCVGL